MNLRFGDRRLPKRFWEKVNKRSNGCWEWAGYKNSKGYGQFRFEGRTMDAHRVAYIVLVSAAIDGLDIDHLCHTHAKQCRKPCRHRACVNPKHHEAVSHAENVRRIWA